MKYLVIFGIGVLVGIIGYYFGKKRDSSPPEADQNDAGVGQVINPAQVKKHKENLGQIVGFLAIREKITNNDVEKLLGVSNATAERYLNELEGMGKITQVGKTGQSVSYTLK